MANATILYWNINNFTGNRIALGSKRKRGGEEDEDYMSAPPGPEHLQMMLNTFNNNRDPMPVPPQLLTLDFIVVVEVYNRNGNATEGALVDGSGLAGCKSLLSHLQLNSDPLRFTDWRLVPPIVTGADGQREAIAVFYRADRWYFLGPVIRDSYLTLETISFLPGRAIPAHYPYYDPQVPEEFNRAGQWQFLRPLPPTAVAPYAPINFPGADNRKPWLTAFGRVGAVAGGPPVLLVRLMSIHTKPNNLAGNPPVAYANDGTRNLADVYEMTAEPPRSANQIDVILGDFNVNNLDPASFQAAGPFGPLLGLNYLPLLRPQSGLPPPPPLDPQNYSYYHTLGRQVRSSRIMDEANHPVGNYPGYEYTNESVDNALVRYQPSAARFPHNTTIVSRVLDTPYVYPPPPPAPPPPGPAPQPGYYTNMTAMQTSIPQLFIDAGLPGNAGQDMNEVFRNAHNYGLIHRVSDHFPLLFDI